MSVYLKAELRYSVYILGDNNIQGGPVSHYC